MASQRKLLLPMGPSIGFAGCLCIALIFIGTVHAEEIDGIIDEAENERNWFTQRRPHDEVHQFVDKMHKVGIFSVIARKQKEEQKEKDHQDGFDEWKDNSVMGVLKAQRREGEDSKQVLDRFFTKDQPRKDAHSFSSPVEKPARGPPPKILTIKLLEDENATPVGQGAKASLSSEPVMITAKVQVETPKDKDYMPGLFRDALDMTETKQHSGADRVKLEPVHIKTPPPSSSGNKKSSVTLEDSSGNKKVVTLEDSSGNKKSSVVVGGGNQAEEGDGMKDIIQRQDAMDAKEMKQPLHGGGRTSVPKSPSPILHIAVAHTSSHNAASAAAHAAAKAVDTLKELKASADRGVTRADDKIDELHHGAAEAISIMKEAKKEAAKTVARLEKKEAAEQRAAKNLAVPLGFEEKQQMKITEEYLNTPPDKAPKMVHPLVHDVLPKSWTHEDKEDDTEMVYDKPAQAVKTMGLVVDSRGDFHFD